MVNNQAVGLKQNVWKCYSCFHAPYREELLRDTWVCLRSRGEISLKNGVLGCKFRQMFPGQIESDKESFLFCFWCASSVLLVVNKKTDDTKEGFLSLT